MNPYSYETKVDEDVSDKEPSQSDEQDGHAIVDPYGSAMEEEIVPEPNDDAQRLHQILNDFDQYFEGPNEDEFERVLKPGGKALIVEACASWSMRLALSATRHEYIDTSVDPFGLPSCQTREGNNWNGNNAIGDALFSDTSRLKDALPGFDMIHFRLIPQQELETVYYMSYY